MGKNVDLICFAIVSQCHAKMSCNLGPAFQPVSIPVTPDDMTVFDTLEEWKKCPTNQM